MSLFKCTICSWTGELPPDAMQNGKGMKGSVRCFRFANGEVHFLVSTKLGRRGTPKFKDVQAGLPAPPVK